MNIVLTLVSVILPLLPVVLFPTRFFGRGLGSTVLGAALLVGMMMLIYFSLGGLMGLAPDAGSDDAVTAALPSLSDADISALEKLLR